MYNLEEVSLLMLITKFEQVNVLNDAQSQGIGMDHQKTSTSDWN